MDQVIQVVRPIGQHGSYEAETRLLATRELALAEAAKLWLAGQRVEFVCNRCGNWESQHGSYQYACGGAEFERGHGVLAPSEGAQA